MCFNRPFFKRVTIILLAVTGALLSGCAGFQGNVYERLPDNAIGAPIPQTEIVFTKEDGSLERKITSDAQGFYRQPLEQGRYRVTASHLIHAPYSSAPGFFVVTGNGYQTGNIFLRRLEGTIVIAVRHAEKASTAANTDLDPDTNGIGIGVSRANALASLVSGNLIAAVFATEWCRTAQTAQPTALALGLPLQVMDSPYASAGLGLCDPSLTATVQMLPSSINSPAALGQHILSNYAGQVVLVVGHSNTVPQLVEALGAPSPCPTYFPAGAGGACTIPENAFNHLFVVNDPPGTPVPALNHQTYGPP